MYYLKNDTSDEKHEISRTEARQSSFDRIEDVETYLDEIETGRFGSRNVQVAANVYWDAD